MPKEIDFIWRITNDVLRDVFKKNEIGEVILPFVVVRRLDCVLTPVHKKVRKAFDDYKDKVAPDRIGMVLRKAAGGLEYFNTSAHTLETLLDEPQYVEINFNNYLSGFNPEVRQVLDHFQFDKVVARLSKHRLLYEMINAICQVDLHPKQVSNHSMGHMFEELIRISNEQSNETAGEHFTPRDVIALMNKVLLTGERAKLSKKGLIRTMYDPACGTGGMVNLGKKYILEQLCAAEGPRPVIQTYGQEINEQSWAIAKSEALITGEDSENIKRGNTFTEDKFPGKTFHYMMANPPYGVTWKREKEYISTEALNPAGRFYAGLPRVSDGQLLFLQHMVHKMSKDGSRMAVVTNGSPLFTGDAGKGESDIRKWIFENDWLECIISLPGEMFYNTGITTYLWFLTNKKDKRRKGKVQLIDGAAREMRMENGAETEVELFSQSMKKSLGKKRNEITQEHIDELYALYDGFEEGPHCKIFDNKDFGYRQLTVVYPETDANGSPVLDKKGKPKMAKDKEIVPLKEDVGRYFEEEVKPHLPEAKLDLAKTRTGYEINFTKYFYKYKTLRGLDEIAKDLLELDRETEALMSNILEE